MTPGNICTYFADKFKEIYGTAYHVTWGKECSIVKSLQKTYSDEQLKTYIEEFLAHHTTSSGGFWSPAIGAFKLALPAVIAKLTDRESKQAKAKCTESAYNRLMEANNGGSKKQNSA